VSILIYDVETTIFKHQKGEERKPKDRYGLPFNSKNKLVMSGFKWIDEDSSCFGSNGIAKITQERFNDAKMIVGHNIKFDLHWARSIGVDISNIQVWDTQIAEWLLNAQSIRGQNSLQAACDRYGLEGKLDVVATEYWDKGIDTDEIPSDVLKEYLEIDLVRTEQVFKKQWEQFKGGAL
jgi:DNA polymerase I-like protein with 3'-5' exonuclease and polymerase domains